MYLLSMFVDVHLFRANFISLNVIDTKTNLTFIGKIKLLPITKNYTEKILNIVKHSSKL